MFDYFSTEFTLADKKKAVRELWIRRYSIADIQKHTGMVIICNGGNLADICKDVMAGNFKLFYHIGGMAIELID